MNYTCELKNPIFIQDFKNLPRNLMIEKLASRLREAQFYGLYSTKKNIDQEVSDFVNHKLFNVLVNLQSKPFPLLTCIAKEFPNTLFKSMVGAGFNLFETDDLSRTVFHFASLYANIKAMKFLFKAIEIIFNRELNIEEIINAKDNHNQNPLHLVGDKCGGDFKTREEKITAAAEWLIEKGIDLNAESDKVGCNFTPLHKATACNREAIVKLVLSKGISPNIKNSLGETPLHIAALHGSDKALDVLLQNNADINAKDNENKTPLMCALMGLTSEPEALTLIQMGAELKTINKRGHTALYYALDTRKWEAYAELINRGVSIEEEIQNGVPLILAACHKAPLLIIEEILNKGGNVFQINNFGQSALHLAAVGNTEDVVEYLVTKYKLDVNLKDGIGMTPLHHAVESLSVEKVKLLLDLGADPTITDKNGFNVYDLVLHLSATMPMFPEAIMSSLIAVDLSDLALK